MPIRKSRSRKSRSRKSAIQTIIISRALYPTKRAAAQAAREHGFKTTKVDMPARGTSYRFRQESPAHFARFITRELVPGITAVIGYYKPRA